MATAPTIVKSALDNNGVVTISPRQVKERDRAAEQLLEKHHELTTRRGILEWLEAVALAVTHDLPEMPRQKANTAAYVSSVALKAIQS